MGNNVFTIISFFYSLIINIIFFVKKRMKNVETNLYSYIIITNLINIIIAMLSYYVEMYNINKFLNNILAKGVIICFYTFSYLFNLYVIYICKKTSDKKAFNNKLTVLLYIIIGLPTLSLPINYYHEGNVIYSYGLCATYEYVVITIMIIYWFILLIKNFKTVVRKKSIPIFTFVVLLIIVAIIQKIRPELLLLTSLETIVIYLMYFTIENPDMRLLEELHKSKEVSDKANEEKTLFLYNMNQEIRNTTNAINEYADNILSSDSLDDDKEIARNIRAIITKFNNESNEILNMTDANEANIKVYNSKYNIKLIIKELVTLYSKNSQEKGLEFRTNIDHDIPEILYGDNISLKEVLNIVLNNSIKYTNKGYVELNINTIVKSDICRLIITIEDSGKGIKSETINSIKNNEKSLEHANKLIASMNGTMLISSDYGIGTKIKIILDQKISPKESSEETNYQEIFKNTKLLVVTESETVVKIISKLIRNSNINTEYVMTEKDCLNKIKSREKYDLILLDESLANNSGEYLSKKIEESKTFDIPIILLTKDNKYEYNDEYKEFGFVDYLLKPLKRETFLNKINKYTEK